MDIRFTQMEWKELRKKIYERDNWTCQKCGKHGGRLNCHHIEPWRISKNNSPNNLITLCLPCHGTIEAERLR
jgi:5-methylcytosine-specific restriction endonuclease McrA